MPRDEVNQQVKELLHEHLDEMVIIQVVHQPKLCDCGTRQQLPVSCSCEPTLLVLTVPGHVDLYVEPSLVQRLVRG